MDKNTQAQKCVHCRKYTYEGVIRDGNVFCPVCKNKEYESSGSVCQRCHERIISGKLVDGEKYCDGCYDSAPIVSEMSLRKKFPGMTVGVAKKVISGMVIGTSRTTSDIIAMLSLPWAIIWNDRLSGMGIDTFGTKSSMTDFIADKFENILFRDGSASEIVCILNRGKVIRADVNLRVRVNRMVKE